MAENLSENSEVQTTTNASKATTGCVACFAKKAGLACVVCRDSVCKHCAKFVTEDEFPFEAGPPKHLLLGSYCPTCFAQSAGVEIEKYEHNMARAGEILVFTKSQRKETHWIKRDEPYVEIQDCDDRDELILRLGYLAAKLNYNAIIDVDIKSEKIRINGYQRSKWSGRGIPANVDESKLLQDRSLTQNPN